MLVWAHQCHLLGGKRRPGEFVDQPSTSAFGEERTGSGGLWARPRVCSRLQPSGCGELSPVTLPCGRSGSAWIVEIKFDSEAARGKSIGPRSNSRGEVGQVCVPWRGLCSLERENSAGTLNLAHLDAGSSSKAQPTATCSLPELGAWNYEGEFQNNEGKSSASRTARPGKFTTARSCSLKRCCWRLKGSQLYNQKRAEVTCQGLDSDWNQVWGYAVRKRGMTPP